MNLTVKKASLATTAALATAIVAAPINYSASIDESIENAQVSIMTSSAFACGGGGSGGRGGATGGGECPPDKPEPPKPEPPKPEPPKPDPKSEPKTLDDNKKVELPPQKKSPKPESKKNESDHEICNYRVDYAFGSGLYAIGNNGKLDNSDRIIKTNKNYHVGKRRGRDEIPGGVSNKHNYCASFYGDLYGSYGEGIVESGKLKENVTLKNVSSTKTTYRQPTNAWCDAEINNKATQNGHVVITATSKDNKSNVYTYISAFSGTEKRVERSGYNSKGNLGSSCLRAAHNVVASANKQGMGIGKLTLISQPKTKKVTTVVTAKVSVKSAPTPVARQKTTPERKTVPVEQKPAVVPAAEKQEAAKSGLACKGMRSNRNVAITYNGYGDDKATVTFNFQANEFYRVDCMNADGKKFSFVPKIGTANASDIDPTALTAFSMISGIKEASSCAPTVEEICKAKSQSTNGVLGFPVIKRQTVAHTNG